VSALVAVLKRDLRGAERAGLLGWARALALAGTGLAAIAAFTRFRSSPLDDIRLVFGSSVFGLMGLLLIFAASFALGAFRAERQAGTLDLLLLAGIRPQTLALGRTISAFFVLLSIAAAALPALALFWFFRTPTPRAWLLHAVALVCWGATLAAAGVAISAWSRRPGTALAGALIVLPGFAALSLTAGAVQTWSAPGLVIQAVNSGGQVDASRAFLCIGVHGALVAAGVLLTGLGLRQARPDAALGDSKPSRRRRRPSERRPLTWLLHRSSTASRPDAQFLALLLALAFVGVGALAAPVLGGSAVDVMHPKALSALGGGIALLSFGTALAAGATRIAAERERRTWDAIAASARSSEKLFQDLIESTLLCCLMPFVVGASLLTAAELLRGEGLLVAVVPFYSLFASLCLASVLGLAASACARGSATALALGSVLLFGVPILVGGSHLIGAGAENWGRALAVLIFLAVLGLPILVRGFGPFILLLIVAMREQARGARGPGSLITRPLFVLVPLALLTGALTDAGDQAWALAFGGAHAALIHVATLGEERSLLDPNLLASGALWQMLFALLVAHGLWRQRDLWLGRAAT